MLVGTWFQCAMEVGLIIGDGKACARIPNDGRTDSLGISALSLEGAMREALRGEGMVAWRRCFCLV